MVFAIVKQVRNVERQNRKVICRVDTWVDVPQEPSVVVHEFLLQRWIRRHSCVIGSQKRSWGIDIITLVQFPLQIWQPHHHSQILPYIGTRKCKCFSYMRSCRDIGSWYLSNCQCFLPFESIEILCEAAAMCLQVVSFHYYHKQCVEFIERVQHLQEISRMSMSCYSKKVSERRRDERGELGFGQEFEKRGLVVIKCRVEGSHKLHFGGPK